MPQINQYMFGFFGRRRHCMVSGNVHHQQHAGSSGGGGRCVAIVRILETTVFVGFGIACIHSIAGSGIVANLAIAAARPPFCCRY